MQVHPWPSRPETRDMSYNNQPSYWDIEEEDLSIQGPEIIYYQTNVIMEKDTDED